MKFLIINNRNQSSLERLIKSLDEKITGNWCYSIFDSTNKIDWKDRSKLNLTQNLKDWLLEQIDGESDDLYSIIDENKFLIEGFDVEDIIKEMSNDDVFCFSLSLGKNITFCSNMNCENIFKPLSDEGKVLSWDWSVHYFDFGYPLNLDGTVFRGKEMRKFVKGIHFDNSLELENSLQIFDNYPKNIMSGFQNGKMVEIVFENQDLWSTFDHNKLPKDRIKYQIFEKNEAPDKVSNEI